MKNNKKITRHPEDLGSVEELFTPTFVSKYYEFRKKIKILIFIGFILKYLGVAILLIYNSTIEIERLDFYNISSFLIILIGYYIYIISCAHFAKLKGYKRFVGGILAFCHELGLIILFILPDKSNKYEVFIADLLNTSNQSKK